MDVQFGEVVKFLREKKQVSQTEMAIALGMSQSQLSRLELGECGTSLSQVVSIAKYFDMKVSELLFVVEEGMDSLLEDDMLQRIRIGIELRKKRKGAKLSMRELSELSGVVIYDISTIEKGTATWRVINRDVEKLKAALALY